MQENSQTSIGRGIRPYSQLDVILTYQNFGSNWLCILRGSTENIDLVFNGLYNLKATNGDYKFFDHANTVATFYSDRKAMRRFFFNQFFFPRCDGRNGTNEGKLIRQAMRYARSKVKALRENGHEFFKDFSRMFMPTTHGVGQVKAENPDSDYKDSVLHYAHSDRS